MSYEIVKQIKVKDGKVYLKSCSNNVWPKDWNNRHAWECSSLTEVLQKQGKEALEVEILGEFESGNFQGPIIKYNKAKSILLRMPEYAEYNWRNGLDNREKRDSQGFRDLLKKALNSKLPTYKYIITKPYYDGAIVYLSKITRRTAQWSRNKEESKVYAYQDQCDNIKKCFTGSNIWNIEKIA